MRLINLLLILNLFSQISFAQNDNKIDLVGRFLTDSFPQRDTLLGGELTYFQKTKIEFLSTPVITSKSGIRVFRTTLNTTFYEYQYLEILISIDSNNKIRIAHSPVFDSYQDYFNNGFIGISADLDSVKFGIINDLAFIYKEIIYDGNVKNIKSEDNIWSAELWHGHQMWRILKIEFFENKLKRIILENPKNK